MANLKVREKRRAARRRKNEKVMAKAQDEVEVLDDEEDLDDDDLDGLESSIETAPQITQKEYGEGTMAFMAPGPVTWDQLDAEQIAREQAEEMRKVTWQTQDLVSNILYSQMPSDKKAGAIKKVGDGLDKRLKSVKPETAKKSVDMDLLEINAIIAKDSRHTSVIQKVGDWVETRKSLDNLSDENFAYVNGTREFPVHDAPHVRASLKLAAKMISDGEDAEIRARQALPKIKEAAKNHKVGIGEKEKGAIVVEKDKSGGWRAVMWPSNNFIDTDDDIISEAAHQEFVGWVNKNMDLSPVFMSHHILGTARKDRVDFVGYEYGSLIMSAPLEENEAAGLLRAQELVDLGMSHGSLVFERDDHDQRIITKYRMVEVSDLPLDHAANPFTNLETVQKEAGMKTLNTKEYLASILGDEEKAQEYLTRTELKQKDLRDAKVEEKEKKTSEPAAATTVVNNAPATVDIDVILKAVGEKFGMNELSETIESLALEAQKVPVLEALIKEARGDADKQLADKIDPPAGKQFSWMEKRASQAKETVLKDTEQDKGLADAEPVVHWLSKATNTQPVASQ